MKYSTILRILPSVALAAAWAGSAYCQSIVSTVAGTEWLFPGGGKAATSAPLGRPFNAAIDAQGNLIFADPANNMVLRVDADGIIRVVAGNGLRGFSGDGGPATDGSLNGPGAAITDSRGVVYIADTGNHRIRKVENGIITTIAGTGKQAFSGDGGPALAASLNGPQYLAFDPNGNLYVYDVLNYVIRRITPSGNIDTFAGNRSPLGGGCPVGTARNVAIGQNAGGIAFDGTGNLYLGDKESNCVRRVAPDGAVIRFAGTGTGDYSGDNGPAVKATLRSPTGIAVDSANNVYIADTDNEVVRRVSADGTIKTFAGNGKFGFAGEGGSPLTASFRFPSGLALDSTSTLYVVDRDNLRIRRVTSSAVTTVAGNGTFQPYPEGTAGTLALLNSPAGLSMDSSGSLLIADYQNNRIRRMTPDGFVYSVAGNGINGFDNPEGPASQIALSQPLAAATDRVGNVYIADTGNHLIRKVSPSGQLNLFAGYVGKSGPVSGLGTDDVAATSTTLGDVYSIAVDAAGNVYLGEGPRVRIVTPGGIISTYAGSRTQGTLDGKRSSAQFRFIVGLSFDSFGNLWIVDADRIRKIDANGNVTTVAGGGTLVGQAAEGRPATQASLRNPFGISVDPSGVACFTEYLQNVIRCISAGGILTTLGGTGTPGFSGDGGIATAARFNNPWGLARDLSGNLLIADSSNNRIRRILTPQNAPSFDANPGSLTLTAKSGGAMSEAQPLAISPSVVGMQYSVNIASIEGGNWLQISPPSGAMPISAQLTGDPTSLAAGTYRATLNVSSPGALQPSKTVTVTFKVDAAVAPKLTVAGKLAQFSYARGSLPTTQQLNISNTGGGSLNFGVETRTDQNLSWLQVSTGNGTITATQSTQLGITADPTGLDPGTYSGAVLVRPSTGDPVSVPVSMTISNERPRFDLTQTGLRFTMVSLGGAPLPQTFGVKNGAQGGLNFRADVSTTSGGSGWLTITPDSGFSDSSATDNTYVTVTIDPSQLQCGESKECYGQITLTDDNAVNSPQFIPVVVSVLPPSKNPGPDISTSGLLFTGQPGSSPGSQTILIANVSRDPIAYTTARSPEAQAWFVAAPVSGSIKPNEYGRIIVQPDFTSLAGGQKDGKLTLRFSDGSVRTISLLGVVAGTGDESLDKASAGRAAAGCAPYAVVFSNPADGSTLTALRPVTISAKVKDACGNVPAGSNVQVFVVFSNQAKDLTLNPSANGEWAASWQPDASVGPITLNVTAFTSNGPIIGRGTSHVSVQRASNDPPEDPPFVTPGAVQNAATGLDASYVAPGSLLTIKGAGFASKEFVNSGFDLPIEQDGTSVLLQGQPLPLLYTSDGQINAQVPYALTENAGQQLIVKRAGTSSLPRTLLVAQAQPGIFTINAAGTGQGFIYTVKDDGAYVLADRNNPAGSGSKVAIYCAGLGRVVGDTVTAGTRPPDPRAVVANNISVTIGGMQAQVVSATLRPDTDLPGRYEVVAVVPDGVPAGDSVPVAITAANQPSNTATMSIR